ncbi:MAG TPA: TylF/MycF/NovP-related O-methyltransferase [Stellaceae bacterium]|nr:TylF/MycF/NovP-related O-methyltransferase [Stellaceae bacterium]
MTDDPTGLRRPVTIDGKGEEPWVALPDGAALAQWGRDEEIAYNQMNRQTEKALFFRRAFDFLTDNRVRGTYLEFGCHRCRTFRMALTEARRHNLAEMEFHAFDSFEGLPQPENVTAVETWQRGALTTSETAFMDLVRAHGIYVDRVRTVAGFYADSLTPTVQRAYLDSGRKAALVNIDCDLYESAVPVFRFIDPLLQEGSILYIDDLFAGHRGNPTKGVARAFLEWQKQTRWKLVRHLEIGWWGRSYLVYLDKADIDGVL